MISLWESDSAKKNSSIYIVATGNVTKQYQTAEGVISPIHLFD